MAGRASRCQESGRTVETASASPVLRHTRAMPSQDPRPPTLEEVARRAGVGRGTASRVVNGATQVSDSARTKVQAAIDELGYVPNRAARALVTRQTESVALVVSESDERFFAEPFFAAIVRGVSTELATTRYRLLLSILQSPRDRVRIESFLTPQHVDGVLLLSLHGDDPLPNRLENRGLPAVLGGRPAGTEPSCYVDVDNEAGAALAVTHLLRSGRRHVATVTGPQDMAAGVGRLAGWRRALTDAGVGVDDELVVHGDFGEASGASGAHRLLERRPDIDAVFAASDPMALGVLHTLAERGRSCPGDVAVVGFDDSPIARHSAPPLTTVHQPVEAMGRQMVRLLVDRMAGGPGQQHVVLDPHLVVRASA